MFLPKFGSDNPNNNNNKQSAFKSKRTALVSGGGFMFEVVWLTLTLTAVGGLPTPFSKTNNSKQISKN